MAEALDVLRSDPAEARLPAQFALASMVRQPSLAAAELLATFLPGMYRPIKLDSLQSTDQSFVGVSLDGRRAMAAGAAGRVTLWAITDEGKVSRQSLQIGGGQLLLARLTADGAHVITSSEDRGLRVWNAGDRTLVKTVRLTSAASAVALTRDLSRAVTGGSTGLVEIWDLPTSTRLGSFQHAKPIEAVAIEAEGRRVAAASEDETASLWDARDGRWRVLRHYDHVYDVMFWDARRLLLTGSLGGDVQIWPVDGGDSPERRLDHDLASLVTKLALSGNGRVLASLASSSVYVWDTTDFRRISTLHEAPTLRDMALSDDGRHVLTAGHDAQAHLWDARSGKEVAAWMTMDDPRVVALSRLAEIAVIGTSAGAQLWRLRPPSRVPVLRHDTVVTRIRLSPDGRVLAALSGGAVWVWSTETGRLLTRISHSPQMGDVALDEHGATIVVADEKGDGAVYAVADGHKLCQIRTSDVQSAAAISPDGKLAVIGSWDGQLVFCDVATVRETARLTSESSVKAITLTSGDANAPVTVGRGDGRIEECRPTSGCRKLFQQQGTIRRLASSSSSRLIASTAPDTGLRLWDVRAGRATTLTQLAVNTDVAMTPAGNLVAASNERGAQMWDTATGGEVWRLGRLGAVSSVALSPAGDRIAVAIGDEVRVLATVASDLIAEACRQTSRPLERSEWEAALPGVRYSRPCPEEPEP